jgi:hypothetical protein
MEYPASRGMYTSTESPTCFDSSTFPYAKVDEEREFTSLEGGSAARTSGEVGSIMRGRHALPIKRKTTMLDTKTRVRIT